jgi:hypothetical protein
MQIIYLSGGMSRVMIGGGLSAHTAMNADGICMLYLNVI